jgi:hypothetical protein
MGFVEIPNVRFNRGVNGASSKGGFDNVGFEHVQNLSKINISKST